MRTRAAGLTPHELEIMKVVWPLGKATVRDVYEALRTRRDIAYTTVQTMMNLLEGKGHLVKSPGPKAQVYAPTKPQAQVELGMVRDFVTRMFDGLHARSSSTSRRTRASLRRSDGRSRRLISGEQ
jgi:predicted transcriptional regulator